MNRKSITILLFGPVLCPGGGMKIILEYANRLVADGYEVNIAYPATINWKSRDLKYKLKSIYHYFRHELLGWRTSQWFKTDPRINEVHTFSLNYRDIPKADIYMATEVRTAPYVAAYPVDNSRKFYFIQGFENWLMPDCNVKETYKLPLNKIVIAKWLEQIVSEVGEKSVFIPNSFDFNYFHKYLDALNRNKFSVSMLYNLAEIKNSQLAFDALGIVKNKYPQLHVNAFGTTERPENMPDWYSYYQRPSQEEHNRIYNESAIFIGTSNAEGWGLTVGEAMICGAAIVCTDIDGYKEMVEDGKNALLSPVKDAQSLAANIIRLIENDNLRIKLAEQGSKDIQRFNWNSSYVKMKETLGLK